MSYIEYCKQAESSLSKQVEFSEELIKKLYARNLSSTEQTPVVSYRTTSIEPVEIPHPIACRMRVLDEEEVPPYLTE